MNKHTWCAVALELLVDLVLVLPSHFHLFTTSSSLVFLRELLAISKRNAERERDGHTIRCDMTAAIVGWDAI